MVFSSITPYQTKPKRESRSDELKELTVQKERLLVKNLKLRNHKLELEIALLCQQVRDIGAVVPETEDM